MSDVTMGGTITPSKVDKSFRYGKSALSSRKHTSGRGEIRGHREFSVTDLVRKRKKHNQDKDVSSIAARSQNQEWDESEIDSDASFGPRSRTRSRNKKKDAPRGFLGSMFHMLDEHPNAPDNLYRWVQLLINSAIFLVIGFVGWVVVDTVRTDIYNANEAARMELMSKMTECQNQYTLNECSKKNLPALKEMCDKWFDCMMQNPESIMRVKVTAKQIAEIMNEFADAMNLKAWVSCPSLPADCRANNAKGFFFAIIVICIFANNLTLGRGAGSRAPVAPVPSVPAHDPMVPPTNTPGFIWYPVETPRRQRHALIDEGTDTDSSPPKMKPLLAAPYTPSRRSPSKGERSRSPVKFGRTPSKGH